MTLLGARSTIERADRRARGAVSALFLTNGALMANLIPRYPEIKSSLGLDDAAYGMTVIAFPAGAILAGLAAGVLVRRFGSATLAVTGTVLTGLGLVGAGLSLTWLLFAVTLFMAGAMDAITDVAQNAHGLRVQRRYGRSILNSLHALWSVGAVLGGAMAAGAIAIGMPPGLHMVIAATLCAVVATTARFFCLPGPDTPEQVSAAGEPARTDATRVSHLRTITILLALVTIAIAGTVVEDAGMSWATLYLHESFTAPAAVAASGIIALVGAQFVGRLVGDRFVDSFGQRAVARAGGVLVFVGMGMSLAFPSLLGSILGFAAAGFGVATLVPAAMREADALPGLRPGTGLTLVSWLMRLGFLLSPPVVGLISEHTSLRIGLLVVPLAGLVVIVLAGVLSNRKTHQPTS